VHTIAAWLIGGGIAALLYNYVGFPLLLAVAGTIRNRQQRARPVTPAVSLLIAAYNEEACIAERLRNALTMDYPADLLEIIVASDGSTDRTVDIVKRYAADGVAVLDLPRRGKIHALTDAVRHARGEVLVFSDANTMAEPAALRALVRSFADAEVGGVVGHTGYTVDPGSESSSHGESLYWRYDTWIKELESRTGSVVSAHGGFYAIRRALFQAPSDAAVTDDFIISTAVVAQGYRLVFEREARAWEVAVPSAEREFQRRIRLMTRGLRAVACRRQLLDPRRYGFYSIVLFSHKVLRRLAVVPLLLVLAGTAVLSTSGAGYRAALIAQLMFYALAGLGHVTRGVPLGRSRFLYVPFYYCMANTAALVAVLRFLRGERITSWQPQRHAGQA
jgi:cellulose synthase/poly-beta-1,6-N-acetylglucosamine synthase-like glycosyltransferase